MLENPKDKKYDNKRIAKNTLFLYVRMIFVLIVSLYTSRVILRILGVEDFGVYNVVAGFISMFSFLNTSLLGAIQRFYNFEKSQKGDIGISNVYNTSLRIQFILALIVLVLLETFGIWYLNNVMVIPQDRMIAANILFQAAVFSSIFVIIQIPYSAAIVSFERMNYFAFAGIADVLLRLIIVIVLPFIRKDKLVIYSILLLIVAIINFFIYYIYAKRQFHSLRMERNTSKDMFRPMLSFAGWNTLGTFATLAYSQGLNLILNFFFGPVVNAARGLANMVMNAIHGFSLNITTAFRPQLIESYASGDYDKTQEIMFSESKFCFLMMYIFVLPVILEIDTILHIWLGDVIPQYTSVFTVLVLIQMIASSFNPAFTQVTHATGNLKTFQIITSIIALSVLPISFLVLKLGYEPYSVFIISIIWQVLTAIACMWLVKRIFDYDVTLFINRVILPTLIVIVISPVLPYLCTITFAPTFIRVIITSIVSIISTSILSYLVLLDKKEKEFVKTKAFNLVLRTSHKSTTR